MKYKQLLARQAELVDMIEKIKTSIEILEEDKSLVESELDEINDQLADIESHDLMKEFRGDAL